MFLWGADAVYVTGVKNHVDHPQNKAVREISFNVRFSISHNWVITCNWNCQPCTFIVFTSDLLYLSVYYNDKRQLDWLKYLKLSVIIYGICDKLADQVVVIKIKTFAQRYQKENKYVHSEKGLHNGERAINLIKMLIRPKPFTKPLPSTSSPPINTNF